jgi:acetyltransferase-like isoleucine patch superfamily enzyme
MERINTNRTDWNAQLFKYFRSIRMLITAAAFSPACYLEAKLKKIRMGRNCRFYGKTSFHRKEHSSIIIGENCEFRSAFLSNLVGLNRRCLIATHHEDARIVIGDNCGFSGTVIGAAGFIRIGNDVLCGANVLITDFDWHDTSIEHRHNLQAAPKPVRIGHNVWLGVNSVVLKGVTIGDNSVIGANSVVVSDIPESVIAAGNPCRVIKPLSE